MKNKQKVANTVKKVTPRAKRPLSQGGRTARRSEKRIIK